MLLTGKRDPQVAVYRRLAPWQRIAAACELYWFAKEIIAGRIKRANPNISALELEKKIRSYL